MESASQITATPLLSDTERLALFSALAGLNPAQLHWVSGYAAGLAVNSTQESAAAELPAAEQAEPLTILYASQTGNGRGVATELAERCRNAGRSVHVHNIAEFKPSRLRQASLLSIVVSTHGEGDPPDDAEIFYDFLLADTAPRLNGLRYSVLALGDSSYANFCQTGREIDQRLSELGAERLLPITECDLDFESTAAQWADTLLDELPAPAVAIASVAQLHALNTNAPYGKNRPFDATVLINQKITGRDSGKDVRHIELSIEDAGFSYQPGDTLAVLTRNPPQLIEQLLAELKLTGEERLTVHGHDRSLGEALLSELEITTPNVKFIESWAQHCSNDDTRLLQLLQPEQREELTQFMADRQIIDIVRQHPASVTAKEFAACLRKLTPRSYSISSSQAANPGEVHLTVAAVHYEAFGSEHWGAASSQLCERSLPGSQVSVYVEHNPRFRLPEDDAQPTIMIAAGTGIAPYRAFIEERQERAATGDNWLFFGERNFRSDFLYQLEWQRHLERGTLRRLDVAFSRDQPEKVYVQDRLREQAADVYAWIAAGAWIYVCGDAKTMAPDVHQALLDIIASEAGVSADEAKLRLRELRSAGRYQRDVY